MRLSLYESDPGYAEFQRLLHVGAVLRITINDQPVKDVVTVDDELGMVECSVRNEDGTYAINKETDEFINEKFYGKVVITVL